MLQDHEKALPRAVRRKILSNRRRLHKRHTPFGRVKVLAFEDGPEPQDERIVYKHQTRGIVDRRATVPLMMGMLG